MDYFVFIIVLIFGYLILGYVIQLFYPHQPDESLPDEERFQNWYDED